MEDVKEELIGIKIRHVKFPQLIGTIAGVLKSEELNIDYEKPYRIEWDEPWLAATILVDYLLFCFMGDADIEFLEPKRQPILHNHRCSLCFGKGFSVINHTTTLCPRCNGSGVVSVG